MKFLDDSNMPNPTSKKQRILVWIVLVLVSFTSLTVFVQNAIFLYNASSFLTASAEIQKRVEVSHSLVSLVDVIMAEGAATAMYMRAPTRDKVVYTNLQERRKDTNLRIEELPRIRWTSTETNAKFRSPKELKAFLESNRLKSRRTGKGINYIDLYWNIVDGVISYITDIVHVSSPSESTAAWVDILAFNILTLSDKYAALEGAAGSLYYTSGSLDFPDLAQFISAYTRRDAFLDLTAALSVKVNKSVREYQQSDSYETFSLERGKIARNRRSRPDYAAAIEWYSKPIEVYNEKPLYNFLADSIVSTLEQEQEDAKRQKYVSLFLMILVLFLWPFAVLLIREIMEIADIMKVRRQFSGAAKSMFRLLGAIRA